MAIDVHRVDAVPDSFDHPGKPVGPLGARAARYADPHTDSRVLGYLAWAALIAAIVVFDRHALDQFRAGGAVALGRENGFLENAQLLAMVPAVALFGFAGLRGLGAVRVAGVLLAMIGTVAFLREIDLASATTGIAGLEWLAAHGLRDALFALLGIAMVLYLFIQRRYFWSVLRLGLRWQAWPCAASVLLLAVAEFYLDDLSGQTAHFWEELVETNGYFLFALAAWKHARLVGDLQLDRPA